MSQATELIARQMAAGASIGKIWGTLIYNVKDTAYGAKGDGVVDDTTALINAVAAASVNGGMVVFPPGTYKTGSFTVPSNVTLWFMNGAKLSINTGTSVVINGPIDAGLYQIFSGSGTVTGAPKVDKFYLQWWGAKGDGLTDDTAAIRSIITAGAGGTVYFPKPSAYYRVVFDNLTSYYNLFNVQSNTRIVFQEGAKIKIEGATAATVAVFGADQSKLPVSNVEFVGINVEGSKIEGRDNPYAIRLTTAPDGPANQIENIRIIGGIFKNIDCAVYIIQRGSVGTTSRQVRNVIITGATAEGCTGSFVTADGENIRVINCTADGVSLTESYDAISIHSGLNIKILNNTFKNYGIGQVVNIRNSPENMCGSRNIQVIGNLFKDCPTTATQISLVSGESVYGVEDVLIQGNEYDNVLVGIQISPGAAVGGTPFRRIDVKDNKFKAVTQDGIAVRANLGIFLEDSEIIGNTGTVIGTGTGLHLNAISRSVVNNNKIYSIGNVAGHKSFFGAYIYYSIVENNHFYADNPALTILDVSNMLESSFIGNYVRGVYVFATLSSSILNNNHFRNNGTNEGRTFVNGWSQIDSVVTVRGTAPPAALAWNTGDKVINTSPTAAGYEGWICVAGGTPGTWKGYGLIQT